MSTYHKVTCPLCNVEVKARVLSSDWRKRNYECSNTSSNGVPHHFSLTKDRWKVLGGLGSLASILILGDRMSKNSNKGGDKFF